MVEAREVLEQVKAGKISIEDAEKYFKKQPFEDLGYAKLDTHREIRSGFPEVIYCSGKPDEYLADIYVRLFEQNGEAFGTRASTHQYEVVKEVLPEVTYDTVSHILKAEKPDKKRYGKIAVCTAGTADIPVAEEAAQTAEYFGANVERVYDVPLCISAPHQASVMRIHYLLFAFLLLLLSPLAGEHGGPTVK